MKLGAPAGVRLSKPFPSPTFPLFNDFNDFNDFNEIRGRTSQSGDVIGEGLRPKEKFALRNKKNNNRRMTSTGEPSRHPSGDLQLPTNQLNHR